VEGGDQEKYGKGLVKCCGKESSQEQCKMEANCKPYLDNTEDYKSMSEAQKKSLKLLCDSYCENLDEQPEWCPSGLSGGAIAGIVIAVVVVVGGAVGAAVFFLVIKGKTSE
jgi:hypothetical protein